MPLLPRAPSLFLSLRSEAPTTDPAGLKSPGSRVRLFCFDNFRFEAKLDPFRFLFVCFSATKERYCMCCFFSLHLALHFSFPFEATRYRSYLTYFRSLFSFQFALIFRFHCKDVYHAVDMQHGHGLQYGHTALTWAGSTDIQHRHAAMTCSTNMHQRHAARTWCIYML